MRYVEADTEFARFGLASPAEQAQLLRAYVEPDVLVLDDLFRARRIAGQRRGAAGHPGQSVAN